MEKKKERVVGKTKTKVQTKKKQEEPIQIEVPDPELPYVERRDLLTQQLAEKYSDKSATELHDLLVRARAKHKKILEQLDNSEKILADPAKKDEKQFLSASAEEVRIQASHFAEAQRLIADKVMQGRFQQRLVLELELVHGLAESSEADQAISSRAEEVKAAEKAVREAETKVQALYRDQALDQQAKDAGQRIYRKACGQLLGHLDQPIPPGLMTFLARGPGARSPGQG